MQKQYKNQLGFSLVELAIVLAVIGLIIGAVIKGQDLIESARLKKVVAQVQEYKYATAAFIDKYDALPGDFSKAHEQIDNSLKNGDGNGSLNKDGLSPKNLQYWSHLAMAGLISPPGKLNELGTPEPGKGIPTTALGGAIIIEQDPDDKMAGPWLVVANFDQNSGKGGMFTPTQALSIIKKMDGDDPMSGKIQARDGSDSVNGCIKSGELNVENESKACVLYFKL